MRDGKHSSSRQGGWEKEVREWARCRSGGREIQAEEMARAKVLEQDRAWCVGGTSRSPECLEQSETLVSVGLARSPPPPPQGLSQTFQRDSDKD